MYHSGTHDSYMLPTVLHFCFNFDPVLNCYLTKIKSHGKGELKINKKFYYKQFHMQQK